MKLIELSPDGVGELKGKKIQVKNEFLIVKKERKVSVYFNIIKSCDFKVVTL